MYQKIKEKRGSELIESAVTTYIIVVVVIIVISVLSVVSEIQTIHNIADQLAVYVEYQGSAKNLNGEFNSLVNKHKLKNATVSIDKTGTIDLQEPFVITVSATKSIGLGGISIDLPISAQATGRGMVYWKP